MAAKVAMHCRLRAQIEDWIACRSGIARDATSRGSPIGALRGA
jgi:hypothetical protein